MAMPDELADDLCSMSFGSSERSGSSTVSSAGSGSVGAARGALSPSDLRFVRRLGSGDIGSVYLAEVKCGDRGGGGGEGDGQEGAGGQEQVGAGEDGAGDPGDGRGAPLPAQALRRRRERPLVLPPHRLLPRRRPPPPPPAPAQPQIPRLRRQVLRGGGGGGAGVRAHAGYRVPRSEAGERPGPIRRPHHAHGLRPLPQVRRPVRRPDPGPPHPLLLRLRIPLCRVVGRCRRRRRLLLHPPQLHRACRLLLPPPSCKSKPPFHRRRRRKNPFQSSSASSAAAAAAAIEFVAEPVDLRSMSFVGTHEYLAPEIVSGEGHGSAVDWWTLGVFIFELLYGATPFRGSDNDATLANIVARALEFPREPHVPAAARDLVAALLVKDPARRLGAAVGAAAVKKHPFFDGVNWALLRCAPPPYVPPPFEIARDQSEDDDCCCPGTPVDFY
uniref:non-specific serine/threonine protein kinase n=1 Tax=Ananas comosus var. bracteatus TaxID=296719 RepID=A0A6V7P1W5_ANACO|nr:unnamed protein product [Ananas comosus var. bracteatus]